MLGQWFKSFLPRGLYGRTALILMVPIVTIQIVLSIVFVQRHFDRVTQQMTGSVVAELDHMRDRLEGSDVPEAELQAMAPLMRATSVAIDLAAPPPPERNLLRAHDLAGLSLIATLRAQLPGFVAVDLRDSRQAVLWIDSRHGVVLATVSRARMSPSNPHQLLVIVLLASIFMTLISFLFLRNQVRPIRRLAAAAEAFGKGQTVDYRPAGATEVRAAGQAFLDMRARIERQIAQRTLMLSGVSHDMRTPLTRMRLTLSMMEESEDTEALTADITELEALLDSFLDFARAHATVAPETVDPTALVAEVVAGRAKGRGKVTLRGADEQLRPMALRPLLIARALDNLVGNALRYGAEAHVCVTQTDTELVIAVEDCGPGIPADRREEAKLPFARLDAARNQNLGGGVGLGLAIAEDAMRQHGGRLILDQSPTFGGLRARLVLPR